MFNDEELAEVVTTWYNRGVITSDNRARLKAWYLDYNRLDGGQVACTSCAFFWMQVLVDVRKYLRSKDIFLELMERKYLFKGQTKEGSWRMFGSKQQYIMEGVEDKYVTVLTDEMVEEFIKHRPELLGQIFEENLSYKDPSVKKLTDEEKKAKFAAVDALTKSLVDKSTADTKRKPRAKKPKTE